MSLNTANPTHSMLRTVTKQEQWDTFISQHPEGHLLQSWGWGDLKAAAGWQPARLALWEGAQIVAAAQILRRSAPYMPLVLGHLAYIPKGPVLDWEQPVLRDTFFAQLHTYLRRQGAIALRMELGQEVGTTESGAVQSYLASQPILRAIPAIQPLRSIVLDLAPEEEGLLSQMKEKWRYNIRLAGRKGVTIRVGASIEDINAWYALLQTTGERDNFGVHTLEYYQQAWQIFAPRNQLRLLLAEHNGQLLAGIFVSVFARKAIYLYGASSNEQRQLMPNYLLQWEAIRWAKQQGATLYDFWGIPETDAEDEAMAGVYRFKRGWGGRVVQFTGCYEQIYRPLIMKAANRFM